MCVYRNRTIRRLFYVRILITCICVDMRTVHVSHSSRHTYTNALLKKEMVHCGNAH